MDFQWWLKICRILVPDINIYITTEIKLFRFENKDLQRMVQFITASELKFWAAIEAIMQRNLYWF